ncbi:APC family permease [Mycoplasmopsis canis]|uniref:APC family permease n=1 Tax=Mycoplasmopsis canis TaxID=29555 RepID=UPI00025B0364|nr:APC family permease [Mycoplasmopsis canis]EIE39359.1 amino acid permease [Mycoplasmopsis canis UF33]WQQ12133.1 APC family permease [Mycoplasmopsis canis]
MKNKLTEKQFIFYGLNYIIGFGFIATISSVVSKGLWGILIFVLTAFISMSVMLAFARGSQNFGKEVGGTYAYAKKAFHNKRAILFLQGWNQFAQVPLFSATTPLFFINLIGEFDKGNQVIYQFSAVAFFIILNIISSFGLRTSKWFILFSAIIKWITIGMGLSIVVWYSFASFQFGNNFSSNPTIDISIIVTSVLSFIYAFAGGEGLAGISADVESKRFKKVLMLIFMIVLTFYFVFYMIYLGLDKTAFLGTEKSSVNFARIFRVSMGLSGVIMFTIGTFFNRVGSSISSIIYYARTVVPLAQDNFIPSFFAKKSEKTGEYRNAIIFSSVFSIISMLIFTIVPYFLGIRDQFAAVLNAGNIVFLMQYLMTIFTILFISYKDKTFKIPLWEKMIYVLAILLIGFIVLASLIPPIVGTSYTVESAILMPSYLGVMILGYVIWGVWYLIQKINSKNNSSSIYNEEKPIFVYSKNHR